MLQAKFDFRSIYFFQPRLKCFQPRPTYKLQELKITENPTHIRKSSEAMILAVMNAIFAIAQRSLKNSGLQRGLNP